EGQPVAGACVFLLGAPAGKSDPLITGSGGDFLAVDQYRGAKVFAVFAPGFAPKLVPLSGEDSLQARVTLTRAESAVAGLVADESGRPLDGVSVAVHRYELAAAGTIVQMGFREE